MTTTKIIIPIILFALLVATITYATTANQVYAAPFIQLFDPLTKN